MYSMQNMIGDGKEKSSLKYSIDKIKIEFQYIRKTDIQSFLNRLQGNSLDFEYSKYYESNKMTNCKYNFQFGEGEGAIYLGVIPNWRKEEKYDSNIVIEYNPNKANPEWYDVFEWLFRLPKIVWRIMSFDVAVDIPIEYETVRMLKRDKREEYRCFGHSSIETQYLGALGNGHVKLYNKALERGLKGIPWTRFEITVRDINFSSPTFEHFAEVVKIPKLYRVDTQTTILDVNDIWLLALEHVIQEPSSLYNIKNYRTREKMKQLLNETLVSIEISVKDMYKTYINFFSVYDDERVVKCEDKVDIMAIFDVQEMKKRKTKAFFKKHKK